MSLVKSTAYAPDIYNALRGILLVHKPVKIHFIDFTDQLKNKISSQLNEYEPRPLEKRLVIEGEQGDDKKLVEVPNLADHPLVVGPRYNPWEIRMAPLPPFLSYRSSGLQPFLIGDDIKYYLGKFRRRRFPCIYHITGRFGYCTDNMFSDGKIIDKATYKHIKAWKIDNALSKIEVIQRDRLFDSAKVPLDSEEAYELAKSWPSTPPKMANWPVLYRIRCIHLNLPEFKLEVVVINENEKYLAHLCQDIGVALKSSAYTHSIRRVKHSMFDISDCLTSSEWDLQSMINNLKIHADYKRVHSYLDSLDRASKVRTQHDPSQIASKISQHGQDVMRATGGDM